MKWPGLYDCLLEIHFKEVKYYGHVHFYIPMYSFKEKNIASFFSPNLKVNYHAVIVKFASKKKKDLSLIIFKFKIT